MVHSAKLCDIRRKGRLLWPFTVARFIILEGSLVKVMKKTVFRHGTLNKLGSWAFHHLLLSHCGCQPPGPKSIRAKFASPAGLTCAAAADAAAIRRRKETSCAAGPPFVREDTFQFGSVFSTFVSAQMICPLCQQNQVAISKSHQQASRVPFSQIGHPTTWLVRSLSASALSLEISFPFVSRLVAVAPIGESNKSTECQNDVELKMSLSNDFHNYLSFEDMWINS